MLASLLDQAAPGQDVYWGPFSTAADVLLYISILTAALIVALTGLRAVITANLGDTAILRVFLVKRFLALAAALAIIVLAPNITSWVAEKVGSSASASIPDWLSGLYDFFKGLLAPLAKTIFALALQIDGLRRLLFMLQYWEHPEADEAAEVINRVLVLSSILAMIQLAPAIVQALADAVQNR